MSLRVSGVCWWIWTLIIATGITRTYASGTCISQFTYFPAVDSCYFISTVTKSWSNAQSDCVSKGGNLVTIDSSAENTAIGAYFTSSSGWIGFNDIASEGTFVWVSGDAVSYTNWNSGEPNNSGNEDCAE